MGLWTVELRWRLAASWGGSKLSRAITWDSKFCRAVTGQREQSLCSSEFCGAVTGWGEFHGGGSLAEQWWGGEGGVSQSIQWQVSQDGSKFCRVVKGQGNLAEQLQGRWSFTEQLRDQGNLPKQSQGWGVSRSSPGTGRVSQSMVGQEKPHGTVGWGEPCEAVAM